MCPCIISRQLLCLLMRRKATMRNKSVCSGFGCNVLDLLEIATTCCNLIQLAQAEEIGWGPPRPRNTLCLQTWHSHGMKMETERGWKPQVQSKTCSLTSVSMTSRPSRNISQMALHRRWWWYFIYIQAQNATTEHGSKQRKRTT